MSQFNIFQAIDTAELASFMREKTAKSEVVVPVGGDTAKFCGRMSNDAKCQVEFEQASRVDLSRMQTQIDYSPRDLVITLGAQSTFTDVQKLLREEQQTIPLDVSHPSHAQLGGIIAANEYGSRAISNGTWRDNVLGMTAVTAAGEIIHVGGQVVKNVAGYDVNKLLIGSLGQLAIITQVSLKVCPIARFTKEIHFVSNVELDDESTTGLWKTLWQTTTSPASISFYTSSEIKYSPIFKVAYSGHEQEVYWKINVLEQELKSYDIGKLSYEEPTHDPAEEAWSLSLDDRGTSSKLKIYCKPIELMDVMLKLTKLWEHAANWSCYGTGMGTISLIIPSSMKLAGLQLQALVENRQGIILCENVCSAHAEDLQNIPFFMIPISNKVISHRIKNIFDPANILNRGRYYSW